MRVLVGTDGSRDARDAVEWLLDFPLPAECSLVTVTAVAWPGGYDEMVTAAGVHLRAEAEGVARAASARLATRWSRVSSRVVEGDPRDVLIEAAAGEGADLAVVGGRGLGAVAAWLLGSVSMALARGAPCPVLVCKGEPRRIRSVTVALDGSEHARAALRFFTALPVPTDLRLHLVAAAAPLRYPSTAPGVLGPHLLGAMKEHEREQLAGLERMLAEAAAELRPRNAAVTATALVGPAPSVILGEAEKHASDLIVVGARGLGVVKRLLLGSVSEAVLRQAACPVLIVRPRSADVG